MNPTEYTDTLADLHSLLGALPAEPPAVADSWQYAVTAERLAKVAARLAGGEYRPAYNGWTNRESWNASLWIGNDQPSYNAAREIIRHTFEHYTPTLYDTFGPAGQRSAALRNAADALRDWYEAEHGPRDTASPLSDAWSYAVAVADWPRIADGLAEDIELELGT